MQMNGLHSTQRSKHISLPEPSRTVRHLMFSMLTICYGSLLVCKEDVTLADVAKACSYKGILPCLS